MNNQLLLYMTCAIGIWTSTGIARADCDLPYNADAPPSSFTKSDWAMEVWPIMSTAVAKANIHAWLTDPDIKSRWYDMFNNPTWAIDGWMRTRIYCLSEPYGGIQDYDVWQNGEWCTGHWVRPDATGMNNGPPDAWTRCPADKPYPYLPQVQVASWMFPWFMYTQNSNYAPPPSDFQY